jgi:FKBP-type peptidyl-prolyl cis-trans isomerase
MATSKAQRIGIIIIAVVMTVGTVGSFFIMILANNNSVADQQKQQQEYNKQLEEYQKQMAEAQKKQDEEAKKLSAQYYDTFKQYEGLPEAYDASKVTSLGKEDLKQGDGAEIAADTPYRAYYIGWNSEGKVFDGSIDNGALKAPLEGGAGLIEGWTQGVIGMKIGGVRVVTIPGDMAYDTDQGADIKAKAPLKFVIMAIPPASEAQS